MTIILWIVGIYLLLVVTWIFYVAIMSFKERLPVMGPVAKFHAYLALFLFGYPLDLIANVIVSALAFQRFPKKPLLTGTLIYWQESTDARRAKWARLLCRELLNPFDPSGKHC
jgi:hypothetical protein